MTGTRAGGQQAAKTNKEKHGDDFYRRIGSKGGQTKKTRPAGFAANPELAKIAGAIGGRRSSREGVKGGEGRNNQPKEYVWRPGDELFSK